MPDIFSMFGGKPIPNSHKSQKPITKVPAKQFLASYMQSPMYKKRLENFGITNKPDIQEFLNTNIIRGSKNEAGSHALTKKELLPPNSSKEVREQYKNAGYKYGYNNVYIDNSQIEEHNSLKRLEAGFSSLSEKLPDYLVGDGTGNMYKPNILAHELSHVSRELAPQEQDFIAKINKSDDNVRMFDYYNKNKKKNSVDYNDYLYSADMHDDVPGELKADLDAFRFHLYKNGIYDTRKGELKLEHIQKAKATPNINSDFNFQRLLRHFTPEDIIKINNTVAYNPTGTASTQV